MNYNCVVLRQEIVYSVHTSLHRIFVREMCQSVGTVRPASNSYYSELCFSGHTTTYHIYPILVKPNGTAFLTRKVRFSCFTKVSNWPCPLLLTQGTGQVLYSGWCDLWSCHLIFCFPLYCLCTSVINQNDLHLSLASLSRKHLHFRVLYLPPFLFF